MMSDEADLAQPERSQLLLMLGDFERVLLSEIEEVRKMILLVRNGGYPPEESLHVVPGDPPAEPAPGHP